MADFNKIIHAIDPSVNVKEALNAAMEMQEPMVMPWASIITVNCAQQNCCCVQTGPFD